MVAINSVYNIPTVGGGSGGGGAAPLPDALETYQGTMTVGNGGGGTEPAGYRLGAYGALGQSGAWLGEQIGRLFVSDDGIGDTVAGATLQMTGQVQIPDVDTVWVKFGTQDFIALDWNGSTAYGITPSADLLTLHQYMLAEEGNVIDIVLQVRQDPRINFGYFEATQQTFSGGPVQSIAMPANLEVGDLILVLTANDDTGDDNDAIVPPAGWSQLIAGAGTGFSDSEMWVSAKIADGSEGVTEDFTIAGSDSYAHFVMRIPGADLPDVAGSVSTFFQPSDIFATAITTLVPYSLVFGIFATDGGDIVPLRPITEGWSRLLVDISTGTSGGVGFSVWYKRQDVPGDTGQLDMRVRALDGQVGVQFSVPPA